MKSENKITNKVVCQSCGMPITDTEHFGINKDKSSNSEYCCFCYQNGEYTDNSDFEEFLDDSLQFYEAKTINERILSNDEILLKERIRLSELKRWNSHQKTHLAYYKSINKVIDYIHNNLSNNISLSHLASTANISDFHFHRIFRAILNESPGDYVQRLRLEKAAFKLKTGKLSLENIAEETGYQSSQALSKAFKKRYRITPSDYRKQSDDFTAPIKKPVKKNSFNPKIKKIKNKDVYCLQVINPYKSHNAFLNTWANLAKLLEIPIIPNDEHEFLCLSRDISTITKPDSYRVYACIGTQKEINLHGKLSKQTIDGGLYAIFTHSGAYQELQTTYCNIYRYWIPQSNYELRDNISFEKYLNSPLLVERDELITEIYIPVSKVL